MNQASSNILTIGNFDGVHVGHRKIIEIARQKAKGSKIIAVTFRPHPQIALRPDAKIPLLTTYDEKIELLKNAGVDEVAELSFSREFSSISPERFFNEILLRKYSAQAVVVGYDFGFGKDRSGNLDLMERLCKTSGVDLTIVPPFKLGDDVVSSSRIRQNLQAGDVRRANQLLGYNFFYRGNVQRGDGRGRKIGFPTANLKSKGTDLQTKALLSYGVYATWTVDLASKKRWASVTNLGVRPTFETGRLDSHEPLIEAHVLGQKELNLYGAELEVQFVERLREERKYDSVEALIQQIARDAENAQQILK